MGTWGPGIFSDDYAADLRGDFRDLIGARVSPADATLRLIEEYQPDADPSDGSVFWLALAAVQWQLGRLEDTVRTRALEVIESGVNLRRWEQEATPQNARKRRAALQQLRRQLLTPPPPPKRVAERYIMETEFEAGDIVRYRLLSGRHILLRVVEIHGDKGGNWPEVEILDCDGDIPPGVDELARAEPRRPVTGADGWSSYKTRLSIFRSPKRDYPAARVEIVARGLPVAPLPPLPSGPEWAPYRDPVMGHVITPQFAHPDYSTRLMRWRDLDKYLRDGFRLD